jgi:PKD repeat protein
MGIGTVLIVFCLCIGIVSAVPPLPSEYYGSVTLDGAPAPAHTVIRAVIGGEVKGEIAVSTAGMYGGTGTFDQRLVISGNESDLGENIVFTVNGVVANQTATFVGGESGKLDLSALTLIRTIPGASWAPRDLDANGKYEDVNGNGRKDFADVVLYFNQMSWVSANEPLAAFDYNGNGRIDFADVVVLFNNL